MTTQSFYNSARGTSDPDARGAMRIERGFALQVANCSRKTGVVGWESDFLRRALTKRTDLPPCTLLIEGK